MPARCPGLPGTARFQTTSTAGKTKMGEGHEEGRLGDARGGLDARQDLSSPLPACCRPPSQVEVEVIRALFSALQAREVWGGVLRAAPPSPAAHACRSRVCRMHACFPAASLRICCLVAASGARSAPSSPPVSLHASHQVTFLDSDATAALDPAALFEHPQYRQAGSMYWPDVWWALGGPVLRVGGRVVAAAGWCRRRGAACMRMARRKVPAGRARHLILPMPAAHSRLPPQLPALTLVRIAPRPCSLPSPTPGAATWNSSGGSACPRLARWEGAWVDGWMTRAGHATGAVGRMAHRSCKHAPVPPPASQHALVRPPAARPASTQHLR